MEMPNVLMLGPSPESMGGMATVEKNILDAIRQRGDRAVFISTYEEGGRLKKLAIAAAAYLSYKRELSKCDLVHVHMASRGSYKRKKVFMQAAFKRNIPVLLHLHGSEFSVWYDTECSEDQRRDIRMTFNRCARVIALSNEWRDFLLSREICSPELVSILHNAVDIPKDNSTDYSKNNVLFMGRLGERKSPDVLLRAAAKVLPKHPDACFIFGGDGDVSAYEQLARDLGIIDSCLFIGWAKGAKKEEAFRGASIFCLPSKNEGMPMSVLEAMSYGLATIATPVGGVPQVISDGVDGLLFPVDDVDTLVGELDLLMSDKAHKARIGKRGRARIEEAFSLDVFIEQIISIYNEVCKCA